MVFLKLSLILSLFFLNVVAFDEEAELREVLFEDQVLLALFTEECCKCTECVEYEATLGALSQTLENMNLRIVKLKSDKLKSKYGIKRTPSLVFFRDQYPLLYEGKLDKEELFWWLSQNREVYTKFLTDRTFEHLTQAATGATTGDWLVVFYSESCADNTSLLTHLEAVAAALKGMINVALVEDYDSLETFERFHIKKCPEVIFLKHGKMYRTDWDTAPNLRLFVERLYKEMKMELVPLPRTSFDKLVDYVVANQLLTSVVAFVGLLGLSLYYLSQNMKPKEVKKD